MNKIITLNPATGSSIDSYEQHVLQEIERRIGQAGKAFVGWNQLGFGQRADHLRNIAQALRHEKERCAMQISVEMGKVLHESMLEVEKCAVTCEYFAEHAQAFLKDEAITTDAKKSFVSFQPLGIVLGIMPWNFPFWQVFRFLAPTLMAGNVCLLKHSSNVTGCAVMIEELLKRAGLPDGVFFSLIMESSRMEEVISNPFVRAVSLTGSTEAGKSVAAKAGKYLKKTVLELGGSDPYIILSDCNLEKAAQRCAESRMLNAGQSCISAKRFIIQEDIFDDFEALFLQQIKRKNMGNPLEESAHYGPLARADLRDTLHRQVVRSIDAGAVCLVGGYIPEGEGFYYPGTVLSNVTEHMPAFAEELFGPVAALIPAPDIQEAIRLANASSFGLGAAIFSEDEERAIHLAETQLEAGNCFINGSVRSDPRLPFGGIKESGYGRELSSFGIKEFVNIKTIYLSK